MAHRILRVDKERSFMAYNIDWSVGKGCWNEEPDVALIQILLNMLYVELPPLERSILAYGPFEMVTERLKVDGICGPKTIEGIILHQKVCQARSGGTVDGKIDPMYADATKLTPRTKVWYSLPHLTRGARHSDHDNKEEPYANLAKREDTPIYLANSLKKIQKAANQHIYGK
jgi:hypothetical protein